MKVRKGNNGSIAVTKSVVAAVLIIVVFSSATVYFVFVNPPVYGNFLFNVSTVTLSSATLYEGTTALGSKEATSLLTFSLNNPSSPTTISSVTMGEGGGLIMPITIWSTTNQTAKLVNFTKTYSANGSNALGGGKVTSFTYYPVSSSLQEAIAQSHNYNYVINFANGQSVSGTLTAVNGTDTSSSARTTSCLYSPYTETADNGTSSWTIITTTSSC